MVEQEKGEWDDDYELVDKPTREQWAAGSVVTTLGRLYLKQELAEARCKKLKLLES